MSGSDQRIGVLASGAGSNLQALLDRDLGAPIVVVISNNAGAGAFERARRAGVATELIDHRRFSSRDDFDAALVDTLSARGVTWVVLAGFMRILGPRMLDAFPRRVVNIHPALLPAFPGVHAQAQALEAGARITGCTVHLVDSGVDTGPILAQAAVAVDPGDDVAQLSARILRQEHRLLPAVVRALVEGRLETDPRGRIFLTGGLDLTEEGALISPRR